MSSLLISMPWASTARPSLGIGALVAAARRNGFECRATYPSLQFAARLGIEVYELIADTPSLFALAEHLFAVDIFGLTELDSDSFLERYSETPSASVSSGANPFQVVRDDLIPSYLDELTSQILRTEPNFIGFSCTFNQVLPSLALARRIKDRQPQIRIALGGASVHDCMGEAYAYAFRAYIDHVFTGESDDSFVELLRRLTKGASPEVPGVTVDGHLQEPARLVTAMDQLPTPDYDDWFEERNALVESGAALPQAVTLPYESARGCWWGAKHHCTFCGLNNLGLTYRVKNESRTVEEIVELASRYRVLNFMAADNILNHQAYGGLLSRLARLGIDLNLFYEIKSNVRRGHVAALASARVRSVQPGVESFSDHVLQLMRKGVTALQNVQMLKWLAEFNIAPSYNILVGFPGETDEDFDEIVRVMEAIRDLPPPSGRATFVQVHRFAPFHDKPNEFGIEGLRPADYYRFLIPPAVAPADGYAFFFERDIPRDAAVFRHLDRVNAVIERWRVQTIRRRARLGAGCVVVESFAVDEQKSDVVLEDAAAVMFVLLDADTTLDGLRRTVGRRFDNGVIDRSLSKLIDAEVVIRVGDRFVATVPLATPHLPSELTDWCEKWSGIPPDEMHGH